jgi:hypothetical protein
MSTISGKNGPLEDPDGPGVDSETVSKGYGPAVRRALDADSAAKSAMGATCRTH